MALKKADVVEALEKAGVQFDPEAKLADLMPLYEALPKEGDAPGNTGGDNGGNGAAPVEEKGGKDTAVVVSSKGQYIRTYSKELHGKDFKDLAKQFAAKVKGSVQ